MVDCKLFGGGFACELFVLRSYIWLGLCLLLWWFAWFGLCNLGYCWFAFAVYFAVLGLLGCLVYSWWVFVWFGIGCYLCLVVLCLWFMVLLNLWFGWFVDCAASGGWCFVLGLWFVCSMGVWFDLVYCFRDSI